MKKGALEVKKHIVISTSYKHFYDILENITLISVSVDGAWVFRGFSSYKGIVGIFSEETGRAIKYWSDIKAQKHAGSINGLEY